MDHERDEYWRVTEYVLDLTCDLILRRDAAMPLRIAASIDILPRSAHPGHQ